MIRILFLVIASMGVLAALGTVLARNLIHAALYLVAFFFVIACLFVLLEVDFLAAIQVLIYIGAIAVLLLFGIMLTRNIQGDETTSGGSLRVIPAGLVALAFFGMLVVGIRRESGLGDRPGWAAVESRPEFPAPGPGDPDASVDDSRAGAMTDVAKSVGVEMLTRYVVAFEAAGLLLTAAIVGAIALAVSDQEKGIPPTTPEESDADRSPGQDGFPRLESPSEVPDLTTTTASARP